MTRLWLVLLLTLSLSPSAASASASVPSGDADEIHAGDADYGSHALRSSSQLGGVFAFEAHGAGCGCTHRTHGGSPALHLLSGSELLLGRVRLLVGPGVQDTDDAVTPLCEQLPYFATAPPSSR